MISVHIGSRAKQSLVNTKTHFWKGVLAGEWSIDDYQRINMSKWPFIFDKYNLEIKEVNVKRCNQMNK